VTMPKMTFILKDGSRKEVEAPLGLSVLEIAHRNQRERLRIATLDDDELPVERIGEPAFRACAHTLMQSACVRRIDLLDRQIDRRPPPRQVEWITQQVGHFAACRFDAPGRHVSIEVGGWLAHSRCSLT